MERKWRKWLETHPTNRADSYVSVEGVSLKIADCNRQVVLEFGMSRRYRTKAQAYKKIGILREALDILETNLAESEVDTW